MADGVPGTHWHQNGQLTAWKSWSSSPIELSDGFGSSAINGGGCEPHKSVIAIASPCSGANRIDKPDHPPEARMVSISGAVSTTAPGADDWVCVP